MTSICPEIKPAELHYDDAPQFQGHANTFGFSSAAHPTSFEDLEEPRELDSDRS